MNAIRLNDLNLHDSGLLDLRVRDEGHESIVEMKLDYILTYEPTNGPKSAPALLRFRNSYGMRSVLLFWNVSAADILEGETFDQSESLRILEREFGVLPDLPQDMRVHRMVVAGRTSEIVIACRSIELVMR